MLVKRFTSFFSQVKFSRWFVMVLLGILIVAIEALEHLFVGESLLKPHFLTEIVTYGIGIPIVGSLLIIWLNRAEEQRDHFEFELGTIQEFNNNLKNASTWDDVVNNVVQFPQFVLPVINTCLTIYDADKEVFNPVASWTASEYQSTEYSHQVSLDACQSCLFALRASNNSPLLCSEFTARNHGSDRQRYCLPLIFRNYLTGLLIFDTPKDKQITSQQFEILKELAPEIALTVDYSHINSMVQNQIDTAALERQRIARDLHDTLGQSISYLRLKLDQMSDQDPLLSIAEFQNDLDHMRLVADEAYDQMRGTLAELHPDSQIRLEDSLRSQAIKVGARAGFEVFLVSEGTPRMLRPHMSRQIQYIFREALNNIEKHANAEHVRICLNWGENDLSISMKDDGYGFNLNSSMGKQNLGFTIMSERAAEIHSLLKIDTAPGQGSTVSLKVPLEI